ncbi:MAG: T9SS type A sorting domain-containing protein [Bacteroidales bacterium]|nr:T9SS type A sorting domain-containing protein [Bacteroidales bacterium]
MKKYSFIAFILFFASFFSIDAQNWEEISKSLPIPYLNATNEQFGISVDIDGNYAVVGAPGYNNNSGRAFVLYYDGTNWTNIATLTQSNPIEGLNVGYSVAIKGDNIVVGCNTYPSLISGKVFVYTKPVTGWEDMTETAVLSNTGSGYYSYFGRSVEITDDIIFVGEDNLAVQGRVNIYEKPGTDWANMTNPTAMLSATNLSNSAHFGSSISYDNDVIVVGAYTNYVGGINEGSAYVFEKPETGWEDMTETAILSASDIEANDKFGFKVAISGDYIAISSTGDDDSGTNNGAVYIYEKPVLGWTDATEDQKLTTTDSPSSAEFGKSLKMESSTLLIGSNYESSYVGAVYAFTESSGTWSNTATIRATDRNTYDYFGNDFAISGNNILIGKYGDPYNYKYSGAVYSTFLPISGYTEISDKIAASTYLTNGYEYFGTSIDIDGDYAVVGAYGYQNQTGCAYILQKINNNWETIARITASDGLDDDYFGYSVAISGDYVVVGSPYCDENGFNSGAFYVFKKPTNGWEDMTETQKTNSIYTYGSFGYSVDIQQNLLIIGAPNSVIGKGSAIIYENISETWTQKAILTQTGTDLARLGYSVAINDTIAIVGANYSTNGSVRTGAVFVYNSQDWSDMTESYKITSPDGIEGDQFGFSIGISDTTFVISAPYNDEKGSNFGAVYVYENNNLKAKLTTLTTTSLLGFSVDISNDIIIAGASYSTNSIYQDGASYIFEKPVSGWANATENQKIKASDYSYAAHYGSAVAIENNYCLVGANFSGDNGYNSGSVYFIKNVVAPTEQDSNIVFTNLSQNSVNLNWSDGNGEERLVFITQNTSGEVAPIDNTDYTANTEFGLGGNIDNWYCVFNGVSHNGGIDITGLNAGTEYRVMVCEKNSGSTTIKYLVSTENNNPANFKTWIDLSLVDYNVLNGQLTNTTSEMEYELTGNNNWITCEETTTNSVDFIEGTVIVREIAKTDNNRLIVTLTEPSAPSFTIDYIAEQTNETIPSTIEYNYDNDFYSSNIIGTNTNLSLTPGTDVYFRFISTETELASAVLNFVVPNKPEAPTNGIVDDNNNTFDWTNNVNFGEIADYEFSLDAGNTWNICTEKPIIVGNIDLNAGDLQLRVLASNNNGFERFTGNALLSEVVYTYYVNIPDLNKLTINIYPNPAINFINIDLKDNTRSINLEIIDESGKILMTKSNISDKTTIDLYNFSKGIYFIKLTNESETFLKKIIIQ